MVAKASTDIVTELDSLNEDFAANFAYINHPKI
jgi:hypothetical protein